MTMALLSANIITAFAYVGMYDGYLAEYGETNGLSYVIFNEKV